MPRRHRLVALIVLAALPLAACSRNNAKRSDVVDAMTDAKLSKAQANCVGDGFQQEFGGDQKLYNDVAAASDVKDLPKGTEQTIRSILDRCIQGGGSSSTETTAGGATTTTAGTATTATTTAPPTSTGG